jgi:hypothetical protein
MTKSIPKMPCGTSNAFKEDFNIALWDFQCLQRGLQNCPMGLPMPSKRTSKLPYGTSNAFKEDFEIAFEEDFECLQRGL